MRTFKWFAHFETNLSFKAHAAGWRKEEFKDLERICTEIRKTFYGRKGKITISGPLIPITITELDTGFFSLSVDTAQRRYVVTEPSLNDLADSVEKSLVNQPARRNTVLQSSRRAATLSP